MAKKKKFFNTKVKNKRKNTIKIAIITVSSILLIILAILIVLIIKNKNNEKDNNLLIKKAVSIEINETVVDSPEILNEKNYEEGWLIKISTDADQVEFSDLLEYNDYLEEVK